MFELTVFELTVFKLTVFELTVFELSVPDLYGWIPFHVCGFCRTTKSLSTRDIRVCNLIRIALLVRNAPSGNNTQTNGGYCHMRKIK